MYVRCKQTVFLLIPGTAWEADSICANLAPAAIFRANPAVSHWVHPSRNGARNTAERRHSSGSVPLIVSATAVALAAGSARMSSYPLAVAVKKARTIAGLSAITSSRATMIGVYQSGMQSR